MANWRNPIDCKDIEDHLERGMLFVRADKNVYYEARRNGRTKVWKRDPSRFSIPIKFAWSGHGYLDEKTQKPFMRIASSRKLAESDNE